MGGSPPRWLVPTCWRSMHAGVIAAACYGLGSLLVPVITRQPFLVFSGGLYADLFAVAALAVGGLLSGPTARLLPLVVAPATTGRPAWTLAAPWPPFMSAGPWTTTPTLNERLRFAEAAAYTSAIGDQRRLTAADRRDLLAMIEVGISPNAPLLEDLGRWTGMPQSLLERYQIALKQATPTLTKETIKLEDAIREHHRHRQHAQDSAGQQGNGDTGPDPAGAGTADSGDPTGTGAGDPSQGVPDPAQGLPTPDGVGLDGLTLGDFLDGAVIGTVWVAYLDWKDFQAGEIQVDAWIGQRIIVAAQNWLAAQYAAGVGFALGGPVGAAVGGLVGALTAVGARAVYKNWQGTQANLRYQAEREKCDAEFEKLCHEHDDRIRELRARYRDDCERAIAGMPHEGDYGDIAWAATVMFEATRNAVVVLPQWRRFPGSLTARQRGLLRAQLRARRDHWLGELATARQQMAAGKSLDSLSLLITINEALLNQFGVLITADWPQLAARLSVISPAWDRDRKSWLARSTQNIQQCLATYQRAADAQHRDFLTRKDALMQRKLKALLVLVNKFRKLRSRKPLRSTTELLKYIRDGRVNPSVR